MLTPVSSMYEIAIDFTVRTGTPTGNATTFYFSQPAGLFLSWLMDDADFWCKKNTNSNSSLLCVVVSVCVKTKVEPATAKTTNAQQTPDPAHNTTTTPNISHHIHITHTHSSTKRTAQSNSAAEDSAVGVFHCCCGNSVVLTSLLDCWWSQHSSAHIACTCITNLSQHTLVLYP